MYIRTCRLCGDLAWPEDQLAYGKRHYSHHECYLKAGKPFAALETWQLERFPVLAAYRAGRLDELKKALGY